MWPWLNEDKDSGKDGESKLISSQYKVWLGLKGPKGFHYNTFVYLHQLDVSFWKIYNP